MASLFCFVTCTQGVLVSRQNCSNAGSKAWCMQLQRHGSKTLKQQYCTVHATLQHTFTKLWQKIFLLYIKHLLTRQLILPYSRSCIDHTVNTSNPTARHDNKSLWHDCLRQDGCSCTGSPEVLKNRRRDGKADVFPIIPKTRRQSRYRRGARPESNRRQRLQRSHRRQ